jgi:hypothetical protein
MIGRRSPLIFAAIGPHPQSGHTLSAAVSLCPLTARLPKHGLRGSYANELPYAVTGIM